MGARGVEWWGGYGRGGGHCCVLVIVVAKVVVKVVVSNGYRWRYSYCMQVSWLVGSFEWVLVAVMVMDP